MNPTPAPTRARTRVLCLLRDSFTFTATALFSKDEAHEKTWFPATGEIREQGCHN